MMTKTDLRQLAVELGFDQLNEDVENDIVDKLNRAAKIEEVDTVTFGLETDDGKIVKVFVNEKDADKFEEKISDLLGNVDSIEDAINQIASDIDIVDVEWPEDEEDKGSAEEADPNLQTDGSEVMNKDVHSDANKNKEVEKGMKPKLESLSTGEQFLVKLNENEGPISSRMVTSQQQLVYQAILDLGVPEIVLNRSPYRLAIINGIKETAKEITTNGSLKTALKMFLKRHMSVEAAKKPDQVKESIVVESVGDDFWLTMTDFTKALDPSKDKAVATAVLEHRKMMQLMARSRVALQTKVPATMRAKLKQLVQVLSKNNVVLESMTTADVATLYTDLIMFADNDVKKHLAEQVLALTAMKKLLTRARSSVVLPADVKNRLQKVRDELDAAKAVRESVEIQLEPEQKEWIVEGTDGALAFGKEGGPMGNLDEEGAESFMKSVANHMMVVLKDSKDPRQSIIISPRAGGAKVIFKSGTKSSQHDASAADLQKIVEAAQEFLDL